MILSLPPAEYRIDFRRWAGVPLLKTKFGVYATPFSPRGDLVRSLDLLREIGVRDLRYELAWGKPDAVASDAIGGTAERPVYDFAYADALLDRGRALGLRPLLALSYCPTPLQTRAGWARWKDAPKDLGAWASVCRAFAAHERARGLTDVRYEAWNEPDMPEAEGKMFFEGTAEDYARVYRATARGVRAGDPDAAVGGPAAAYDLRYLAPVVAGDADFASIHGYANYRSQIAGMRKALAPRRDLPIFLTEYASFSDFRKDGPAVRSDAAAAFFRDADGLLRLTDVTKVYWAQWIDDYLGLVSRGGRRRALFNAFEAYGAMPADRVEARLLTLAPEGEDGSAVVVLATASPTERDVVVANPSDHDRAVTLRFDGLPPRGRWALSRIDRHHASFVDDPSTESLRIDERPRIGRTWRGTVPAQGVVLLRSGATAAPRVPAGTAVRSLHDFGNRASPAYADFDPASWTARLGLGSARVGVEMEGLGGFRLSPEIRGGGTLSLSLSFRGRDGRYGSAVELPPRGLVDPRRLAPPAWDGHRAMLTFVLRNATEGSHARIALVRP